ncbi:response regulator [Temperatibacter marinus]|uniref:histidine kinase n=1 Tax=Temperatibacter marinus TaxID=1456591 RepID=A0AA52EF30_9PROT|nr:response regulator [Temperatibacter marinus]WND01645.1 response regulator [Temperatibacter marinus]
MVNLNFARLTIVIGVVLTLISSYLIYTYEKAEKTDAFLNRSQIASTVLGNKLRHHVNLIKELEAFLSASNYVSQDEFDKFLNVAFSGIQSMISVYTMDQVETSELAAWTATLQRENPERHASTVPYEYTKDWRKIYDLPKRRHYLVAYKWNDKDPYIKSGFDYGSYSIVADYYTNHTRDDEVYISPIQFQRAWGATHSGYWVVSKSVIKEENGVQKRKHIATALIDIRKFLKSVMDDLEFNNIQVSLLQTEFIDPSDAEIELQGADPFATAVNYEYGQKYSKSDFEYDGLTGLYLKGKINFPYSNINMVFTPTGDLYSPSLLSPTLVLFFGLLVTALLFWSVNNLQKTKALVEKKVERKTKDLVTAYNNLEEKQSELATLNRELEKAMTAAQSANKAKSQFLANMSHELRTPLNAIIGYSEMLKEDAEDEDNDDQVDDLGKVLSAGRHLLGLINDILDLSRIEADKMNLIIEEVGIEEMVRSVSSTTEPLFKKNNNYFSFDVSSKLTLMHTDEQRVRQILFNLLSNAAKFTADGNVRLIVDGASDHGKEQVVFRVEDTGIGMSENQVANIFEAFTQADASTTRNYGGSGLGLAISKEFSELLGGDLSVRSTLGEGSTFTFKLPLAQDDILASQGKTTVEPLSSSILPSVGDQSASLEETVQDTTDAIVAQKHDGNETSPRVLIIDDESVAREITKRYLSSKNVEILEAENGNEGLQMAREFEPDLIILDIMMPELNGWAVLELLKAEDKLKNIPVIICTMVDEAKRGYVLGATDYIQKPVNKDDLLKRVTMNLEDSPFTESTVLIVEDEKDIRDMMDRLLKQGGFTTLVAENGKIGLEKLNKNDVDVILLDLMMPVMDGFDFMEHFRRDERHNDIPIIIVTAKEITTEDRMRLDSKVYNIMRKGDYSRDQLLSEVDRLTNRAINESRV